MLNTMLDLESDRSVMSADEMNAFIESVGRSELFEEIEELKSDKRSVLNASNPHPYPRYLKAVLVSLVALQYDERWVNTTFKDALDKRYYK